ncbi:hypothetical protein B0H14DRAFT_2949200 [Mycena olivaceomarginata]|nr:hypothetical protein B0H14DRAFT_2949200 [Mycena olivaceomarginata]
MATRLLNVVGAKKRLDDHLPPPTMDPVLPAIDKIQLASPAHPVPDPCNHKTCEGHCWKGYPQSRFPNWTLSQVQRSGIYSAITEYNKIEPSTIYSVDVDSSGFFTDSGKVVATEDTKDDLWNTLIDEDLQPSTNIRVRALFIEHLTGPVLMMLGARYNIEPFFFSSSLGWIPSRYQEDSQPGQGDHITITLTFLRPLNRPKALSLHTYPSSASSTINSQFDLQEGQVIDIQAPLFLHSSNDYLILDLLAVHLIRSTDGSTIISYHNTEADSTSAAYLHERIRFAGQSVYWQSIFQSSPDPTFVLLIFVWHAMYAWDESLELLYSHICHIETQDFRKALEFVLNTPNPAMEALPEEERARSWRLLQRECNNLLSEIGRLEQARSTQEKRLKNVMNLVFSSVNIGDSRRMQRLTEAAVRDSTVAYLSMIFLPASLVAAIFGMNIHEIAPGTRGSLSHYFEIALPLTLVTFWVVVAFRSEPQDGQNPTIWMRLIWPMTMLRRVIKG